MLSRPSILLRLEGAALFAITLYLYHAIGASWTLFAILCLAPDLAMLGYLANVELGARLYNLFHAEAPPILLAAVSLALHKPELMPYALIWLAHIGWDRALGYGLKYPTFFKDTHLQRT
jgi:hypothetical protein